MGRKKSPPPPNPLLTEDHGILTVEAVVRTCEFYTVFEIKLKDGDKVSLTGEVAQGILKIRDALNLKNQGRMNRMDLLEILNIYDKAIQDGVLKPSRLLTMPRGNSK